MADGVPEDEKPVRGPPKGDPLPDKDGNFSITEDDPEESGRTPNETPISR